MVVLNDGVPMVTVGAVLSTVVVPPVNGTVVLKSGDKFVALSRLTPIVPSPVPVFTVTI